MDFEENKIKGASIGNEIDHFIYRVPKKNHDSMLKINKRFANMITKYGAVHQVFQLNTTKSPMEGIDNISKIVSASEDDEVWMEQIIYRDRNHKEEIGNKMKSDEKMIPLYQESLRLLARGSNYILGEFTRLTV